MSPTKIAKMFVGEHASLFSANLMFSIGKMIIEGQNFLVLPNNAGVYVITKYDGNQERMRDLKGGFFGDLHANRFTKIDQFTYNSAYRERKVRKELAKMDKEEYIYEKCKTKRPSKRKVQAHVGDAMRHRVLMTRHFDNHVHVACVGYTTE